MVFTDDKPTKGLVFDRRMRSRKLGQVSTDYDQVRLTAAPLIGFDTQVHGAAPIGAQSINPADYRSQEKNRAVDTRKSCPQVENDL